MLSIATAIDFSQKLRRNSPGWLIATETTWIRASNKGLTGHFFFARPLGDRQLLAESCRAGRCTLHGGVLATLADVGMGYAMAFSSDPPQPLITASMTLDYLGPVQINEWLEVRLEYSRKGRQLAFAAVSLHVGERTVARASAVFAVPMDGKASKEAAQIQ